MDGKIILTDKAKSLRKHNKSHDCLSLIVIVDSVGRFSYIHYDNMPCRSKTPRGAYRTVNKWLKNNSPDVKVKNVIDVSDNNEWMIFREGSDFKGPNNK